MLRRIFQTLTGLYELARLLLLTRGRLRGRYWRWRRETAFGPSSPTSKLKRCKAILGYGAWAHEMRRRQ